MVRNCRIKFNRRTKNSSQGFDFTEHYDYLKELLQSLVPNCSAISEWFQLGQLLWDYLEVHRVVKQALAEQNVYELERRRNQISSICARIVRWPCKTVKDR